MVVAVFYTVMHYPALYLLFLLITQYKYTFVESSIFLSFIWYQICLNMVKLKVGHDLNNIRCHGNNLPAYQQKKRPEEHLYARNNQLYT